MLVTNASSVKKTRAVVVGGSLATVLVVGLAIASGGRAGAAIRATSQVVGDYSPQTATFLVSEIAINLSKEAASSLVLYTVPHAHVAFVVNIAGSRTSITGTARADAKGKVTISFFVPLPASSDAAVTGTVQVHVTDPGKHGTATFTFHALPLLQYTTATRIHTGAKGTTLTVTVRLAQPARVAVTVTLQGKKKPLAAGKPIHGDVKHPVQIALPLGMLKGHVQAMVAVTVTGANGKSDTLSFPMPLQ